MPNLESRLREAVEALPMGLRDHVLRVEVEAVRLANKHGVDRERARLAALGHDLVRHKTAAELLALAIEHDLETNDVERAAPILIHGPLAARILATAYGLHDAEVLAAVDCHTTARAGMSPLEKVLFIADKVEPEKIERNPSWREVRDLAETDPSTGSGQGLDRALLRWLDLHLEEAVRHAWPLHPRSVEARNELLLTPVL